MNMNIKIYEQSKFTKKRKIHLKSCTIDALKNFHFIDFRRCPLKGILKLHKD